MQYNNLPGTNLKLSALSLGTMMFGGQTSEADSLSIMDYAYEHGMNFWDTANMYNEGECEKVVGKGLKNRRERIFLATKVNGQMGDNPFDKGLSRRNIFNAVDASLKRLGTDYIDLYYMHHPDHETDIEQSLEAMTNLVWQGKIHYIGVSNFAAWQIADMLAICDKRGYIAPVISQNVYNPITRGVEQELVPFLLKHKMGMAVYNPLAAGLLAGKHKPGQPADNTRFSNSKLYYDRYWSDENFAAVEKLTNIAQKFGLSLLELAYKWCASRQSVTTIICGVSKLSQLEQNIATMEGAALSDAALAECDDVWRSLAGTRFAYNR
ncbi:MAG: aldo/keto reductase [Oscillospiraceae bacterium]|jgi:aryl-alcohol dehydrogenase-like predicted oxidoreductase|nr:aldo/keto reductase [Oscillospiraceae bacterium]